MAAPLTFQWTLETAASPARAWEALADTDRFNLAVNAGFHFARVEGADGQAVTRGSVSKLGLRITWDEVPFAFRKHKRFRSRRVFHGGPAAVMTADAELTPRPGGGTILHYELSVTPRAGLLRPILALDLKRTTVPSIEKALQSLAAWLDLPAPPPESTWAVPAPVLRPEADAFLISIAEEMPDAHLRDRLVGFLRAAPERDQARMNPIALAAAWGTPLDDTTRFLVDSARTGLLGVRLDLLCPACLVPRRELAPGEPAPQTHCEGCGIALDAAFPSALAVHFCPAPRVRTPRVEVECLGSPAQRAHVFAQEPLAPGASADLATDLEPGTFRLRTVPEQGPPALLEVRDGEPIASLEFEIGGAMVVPQYARTRPSPRSITVNNRGARALTVVLERLIQPTRMLTLGRTLAEFPELAELVPRRGYFAAMQCFHAVALAVRFAPAGLAERLGHARSLHASEDALVALYASTATLAQDLAGALAAAPHALFGVAAGAAFEHELGGRRVPMGPAVDAAWELASTSARPGVAAAAGGELDAEGPEMTKAGLEGTPLDPPGQAHGLRIITRPY